MKGLCFKQRIGSTLEGEGFELVVQENQTQVLVVMIEKGQKLYIEPGEEKETLEFIYIIQGHLRFKVDDEMVDLEAGDSFYTYKIKETVIAHVEETTKMLYYTTEQVYEKLEDNLKGLKEILLEIQNKDYYTEGHSTRVAMYAATLLQHCGKQVRSPKQLGYAAQLHDIGKCKIPDEILLKPGRLTPEERKEMNRHAEYSAYILKEQFGIEDTICHVAACHHERYDGSGYPYGLKGETIPIESRIIAIVDTFDAMTTDRPYQKARTPKEAVEEMQKFAYQFDPELLEIFIQLVEEEIIHPNRLPKGL